MLTCLSIKTLLNSWKTFCRQDFKLTPVECLNRAFGLNKTWQNWTNHWLNHTFIEKSNSWSTINFNILGDFKCTNLLKMFFLLDVYCRHKTSLCCKVNIYGPWCPLLILQILLDLDFLVLKKKRKKFKITFWLNKRMSIQFFADKQKNDPVKYYVHIVKQPPAQQKCSGVPLDYHRKCSSVNELYSDRQKHN